MNDREIIPPRPSLGERFLGYFLPCESNDAGLAWSPASHLRHARRYLSRNLTAALVLLAAAAGLRGLEFEMLSWGALATGCLFACLGTFMIGAVAVQARGL
ncbi:MAG TPA: hypothetical protein VKA14_03365 [Gammaproteobacteria bacterium]|nr:hypothetical protein [Gammaproteobacteria bacterium]